MKFTLIYVIFYGTPVFLIGYTAQCEFQVLLIVIYILFGMQSMMFMFVAFQLRKYTTDAFFIKQEFWILTMCVVLGISSHIAIHTFFDRKEQNKFANFVEAAFFVLLSLLVSIFFPFWRASRLSRMNLNIRGSVENVEVLRDLLQTASGYESFIAYLQTEFSAENGLFWKAVQEYRKHSIEYLKKNRNRRRAILHKCIQVYDEYIRAGAVLQVNISWKNKQIIEDVIAHEKSLARQKVSSKMAILTGRVKYEQPMQRNEEGKKGREIALPNIFDGAQQEIYQLMERDSLQRYINSEMFTKWRNTYTSTRPTSRVEISTSRSKRYQTSINSPVGRESQPIGRDSHDTRRSFSRRQMPEVSL